MPGLSRKTYAMKVQEMFRDYDSALCRAATEYASRKSLKEKVNLTARIAACSDLGGKHAAGLVLRVVEIAEDPMAIKENLIFVADSIMRHAAREGRLTMSRFEKAFGPKLVKLFRAALRRADTRKLVGDYFLAKVIPNWRAQCWFTMEMPSIVRLLKATAKLPTVEEEAGPKVPTSPALAPDEGGPEYSEFDLPDESEVPEEPAYDPFAIRSPTPVDEVIRPPEVPTLPTVPVDSQQEPVPPDSADDYTWVTDEEAESESAPTAAEDPYSEPAAPRFVRAIVQVANLRLGFLGDHEQAVLRGSYAGAIALACGINVGAVRDLAGAVGAVTLSVDGRVSALIDLSMQPGFNIDSVTQALGTPTFKAQLASTTLFAIGAGHPAIAGPPMAVDIVIQPEAPIPPPPPPPPPGAEPGTVPTEALATRSEPTTVSAPTRSLPTTKSVPTRSPAEEQAPTQPTQTGEPTLVPPSRPTEPRSPTSVPVPTDAPEESSPVEVVDATPRGRPSTAAAPRAAAGAMAPPSPTEVPVPTDQAAPTSEGDASDRTPAPAPRRSRPGGEPSRPHSPTDMPEPTSPAGEEDEAQEVPPPVLPLAAGQPAGPGARGIRSSPTDLPVPTAVPSPTSQLMSIDYADGAPPGIFDRVRPSPTDRPVPIEGSALAPTRRARASALIVASSPTEMPFPTQAPSPTSLVASDDEDVPMPPPRPAPLAGQRAAGARPTDPTDVPIPVPADGAGPPAAPGQGPSKDSSTIPSSPTEMPVPTAVPSPTSQVPSEDDAPPPPAPPPPPPPGPRLMAVVPHGVDPRLPPPASPTEMPVPTVAAKAPPKVPSSPTEMPVPTAVPSPTSPARHDDLDVLPPPPQPAKRSRAGRERPSSPTDLPVPTAVPSPTDRVVGGAEVTPLPLRASQPSAAAGAGTQPSSSTQPSSPTEMPVPTAVPSPTSHVPSEEEDAVPPPVAPRGKPPRATAKASKTHPSSPTEMPVPTAVPSPTSPVVSLDDEVVAAPPRSTTRPAGEAGRGSRIAAPSSPTELPVPTAAPSPTSPVPTEEDEHVAGGQPEAPLPVPRGVASPTSRAPAMDEEHIRASDARSTGPRPATGRADESPTELPVPTLAPAPTSPRTRAAAGGPSPTDMPPVPTAVPSPTSPVPTDQREDEQTVPVGTAPRPGAARPRAPSSPTQGVSIPVDVPDATSPAPLDEAPEDKVLAPRRAAKEAGQSSRHSPTSVAPTPATELIGPPSQMPAASRKESSDTLASSPTEMPVPTAAPSPTSHVPVDEDEQVRPPRPKTSRPGAPAPSSPTEIPLPPVDVQTATSPVPLEGEEVITPAPAGASARRSRAPSSPTEMPVPTAVPTPTSPVASPDDDAAPGPPERRAVTQISARVAPSSPTGLPVPTAAPSPTSQVPMVDEERVQPPRAPPAARPRGLDAPSSPTEMPVPTAVPSPTSPVATDGDDDEKVPGPVVRHPVTQISARPVPPSSPTEMPVPTAAPSPTSQVSEAEEEADDMLPPKPKVKRIHPPGRAAPSSPTELPLPAGAAEPTSPAPFDEEEQVGMAPSVPPRRKGAAPSSPTEMPVPSESKRAAAAPPKPVGTTTPSSPTELPVPTEMPAPTSPAPSSPRGDEGQTVPALPQRRSKAAAEPSSPAEALVPAGVPSPTSIPDEEEELVRPTATKQAPAPRAPAARGVPAASSPTEVPVPTEMPAPTSPAPSSPVGGEHLAPLKRSRKAAASSPTEMPHPGRAVAAATSPAYDDDEQMLPPQLRPVAPRRKAAEVSSPTEMPVPTAAPSPTSAAEEEEDGERDGGLALKVPQRRPVTELPVPSPTSIAPYDDGDEELVQPPLKAVARRGRKGQPTSPTEIPQARAVHSPTSAAPDEGEEDALLAVPQRATRVPAPPLSRPGGPTAPSSPTELPVPTLVPSPTSPAPADDEELPVPRRGRDMAPPSPTYLPGVQHEPTSPADENLAEDQQLEGPPSEEGTRTTLEPTVPTEVPSTRPTTTSDRVPTELAPSEVIPTLGPTTRSVATTQVPTEDKDPTHPLSDTALARRQSLGAPQAKRRKEGEPPSMPEGHSSIATEFTVIPPTPSQARGEPGTPTQALQPLPGTPSRRAWKGPPTPTAGSAGRRTPTRAAAAAGVGGRQPPTPPFSPTEEVFAPATPEDKVVGRALRAAAVGGTGTPRESPTYVAEASAELALPPTPTYEGSSPTYVDEDEPPTPTLMDDSAAYGDDEDAQAVAYFGVLEATGRGPGTPQERPGGTPTSTLTPGTPAARHPKGSRVQKPTERTSMMRLPGLESPTPTYDADNETVFGDDAESVVSWLGTGSQTTGGITGGSTLPPPGTVPLQPATPRPWHAGTPPGTPVPYTPPSGLGTPPVQPGTPLPPVQGRSAGVVFVPPATSTPPAGSSQAAGSRKRGTDKDEEDLPPWKRRERRRQR